MKPKYLNVKVRLTGEDGNAFSIIGRVQEALRRAKVPAMELKTFRDESMSGDYDHVLQTAMAWVTVS